MGVAIAGSCLAGSAAADIFTYTGQSSGDWDDPTVWTDSQGNSGAEFPGAADRAIIPFNKRVFIRNGMTITVDTIWIQGHNGQIIIEDSGELILENNDLNCGGIGLNPTCSTADHSRIDGQMFLQTSDHGFGPAGKLTFKIADHIIAGSGKISSIEDKATIIVDANIKFTSRLNNPLGGITGALQILAGPTFQPIFRNEGVVHATSSFDNQIVVNIDLEDITGAKWQASDCAVLEIVRSADLSGDFEDTGSFGGKFSFIGEIRTCGKYLRVGCSCIDINELNPDSAFRYAVFENGISNCLNPGDSVPLWLPCSTLPDHPILGFEIMSDVVTSCGCG